MKSIEEKLPDELAGKRGIIDEAIQLIWDWSYRTISVEDIARRINVKRRTFLERNRPRSRFRRDSDAQESGSTSGQADSRA